VIVNVARVIATRLYHFVIAVWRPKEAKSTAMSRIILIGVIAVSAARRIRVNYWEIIADNLSKAGWNWAVLCKCA
jgi:hypothetical protein